MYLNFRINKLCFIIFQCRKLETVNITQLKTDFYNELAMFAQNCKLVKSLNLSLCNRVDDKCVELIVRNLKMLTHLHLISTEITDNGKYATSLSQSVFLTIFICTYYNITISKMKKVKGNFVETSFF